MVFRYFENDFSFVQDPVVSPRFCLPNYDPHILNLSMLKPISHVGNFPVLHQISSSSFYTCLKWDVLNRIQPFQLTCSSVLWVLTLWEPVWSR